MATNLTNGIEDDEEIGLHPVKRPTNIENDVSSLDQKKKVSSILQSPFFKEELETAVTDLLRSGQDGGHVIAKEIANFFSPVRRSGFQGIGCVTPINDLPAASPYTKQERIIRCKLAALYRIIDLYGWSQTIFNHTTVRIDKETEQFLINPFGLLSHEISASKLIKVTMQGDVIDGGSTTLGLNKAGYILHSAIHQARPDLHCVIHVHTGDAVAISCMECGLLPISQEALIIGDVSYHNYNGILVDQKERKALQKHLGPNNKVMFLRNHGVVACGETVEEAFHYLFHTMLACQIQVKAMSCMRHDKLIHCDKMKTKTEDIARDDVTMGADKLQWGVGEMMFEALVRMLDDMGYRSGYTYRNPNVVKPKTKQLSECCEPATAVGPSPVSTEALEDMRGALRRTGDSNSRWVNSPNTYTRVVEDEEEQERNGDLSPKTKTKWKRSSDAGGAPSMRISNANQFVPAGTDPRDVIALRKSIRGKKDHNAPGPQSQFLASVSPHHKGDGITTSSKGIIEKGETILLVAPVGPPNPFSKVTDDEIKLYQKQIKTGDVDDGVEQTEEVLQVSTENSQAPEETGKTPEKVGEIPEEKVGKTPEKTEKSLKSPEKASGSSEPPPVAAERNENGNSNQSLKNTEKRASFEAAVHNDVTGQYNDVIKQPNAAEKKKKKKSLSFMKKKKSSK